MPPGGAPPQSDRRMPVMLDSMNLSPTQGGPSVAQKTGGTDTKSPVFRSAIFMVSNA